MARKPKVEVDDGMAACAAAKAMGAHLAGLPIVTAFEALSMVCASAVMTVRRDKKAEVTDEQFFENWFTAFRSEIAAALHFLLTRDAQRAQAKKERKRKPKAP